jgi:hypothetical protein
MAHLWASIFPDPVVARISNIRVKDIIYVAPQQHTGWTVAQLFLGNDASAYPDYIGPYLPKMPSDTHLSLCACKIAHSPASIGAAVLGPQHQSKPLNASELQAFPQVPG